MSIIGSRIIFRLFIAIFGFADIAAHAQETINTLEREVEQLAGHHIAASMSEHLISGVVISVVKDGEVIFNQGYGVTDTTTQPADATD